MRRAFVKETDDVQEILPHPNLVTPQGLALIEHDLSAAADVPELTNHSTNTSAAARITFIKPSRASPIVHSVARSCNQSPGRSDD